MEAQELIDVNKFAELANIYVTANTSPNDILSLPDRSIIFAHDSNVALRNVFPHIRNSKNKYIVITVRDIPVNDHRLKAAPSNVLKWFANNVMCSSRLSQGIPIGLPPVNLAFNHDDGTTGEDKRTEICQLMGKEKKISNLVYMNHANHTNPSQRVYLYSAFKDSPWMTTKGGGRRINYSEYINDIHSHKYMLCPPGAGIDCHRVWESLYLGTIPIVKRSTAMSFFKELPIIFVDDFSQVSPDFLSGEVAPAQDRSLEMLSMSYWTSLIRKIQELPGI